MKYIDIHTHALTHDQDIIEVQSLDPRVPVELSLQSAENFCFGLHPWHIDEVDQDTFYSSLKTCMQSPGFFGLGEIGLDRSRMENFEDQKQTFLKQLDFARKFRVQRLVIHCVKSYFDILPELQKLSWDPVIILHDFNSNMETVEKYMNSLNAYFSFGAKLFKENTSAAKTFANVPLERVFLETDEQLDHSIMDIYQKAAELRKLGLEELIEQLNKNYYKIMPSSEFPISGL